MKKILSIFLISILSLTAFTQSLPNQFTIDEYVMSIGTDFKINDGKGYIDEDVVSLGTNYTLKVDGTLVAKAKQQLISIGSKINIYDGNGNKIGSVEEVIFTSMFGIYSKYNIYDGSGTKVAFSEKHSLMETEFVVKSTSGNTIAVIKRPMINMFSDTWDVNFKDSSFDKRLIIFIPCYKTNRDNKS